MKTALAILALLVILGIGAWWFIARGPMAPAAPTGTATTTALGGGTAQTVTTPSGVSFSYADPYGLATTPEQVLVKSYIPACDEGFDYCLYRTGDAYANTNFESAGLSIRARKDLTSQNACLATQPSGYSNLHATTTTGAGYATSVFAPLGDAAAGHYANGAEYRLWTGTSCVQLDARIGETQFANYPAGTKTEFTAADRAKVMGELTGILNGMTLNGSPIAFPKP